MVLMCSFNVSDSLLFSFFIFIVLCSFIALFYFFVLFYSCMITFCVSILIQMVTVKSLGILSSSSATNFCC